MVICECLKVKIQKSLQKKCNQVDGGVLGWSVVLLIPLLSRSTGMRDTWEPTKSSVTPIVNTTVLGLSSLLVKRSESSFGGRTRRSLKKYPSAESQPHVRSRGIDTSTVDSQRVFVPCTLVVTPDRRRQTEVPETSQGNKVLQISLSPNFFVFSRGRSLLYDGSIDETILVRYLQNLKLCLKTTVS